MTRRSVSRWLLAAPVALSAALAVQSCSSTPAPVGLAEGCSINSDCNSPLICAFQRCHTACANERDCPMGQRCVSSGVNNVCQLQNESTCAGGATCPGALVCASDMQCRNVCSAAQPCAVAGQACVMNTCSDLPDGGGSEGGAGDGGPDSTTDSALDTSADTSSGDSTADAPDACTPLVPEAGTLSFTPSNFAPNMLAVADGGVPDAGDAAPIVTNDAIDWANAPDVTISNPSCDSTCLPKPVSVTLSDGSEASLYVMKSFTVLSSTVLELNPYPSTKAVPPVIFAVLTTVDIQGEIDIGAATAFAGPGALSALGGLSPNGPGGGGNGLTLSYPGSSPGGGSYCGVGGKGGFTVLPQSPGGGAYGNARIVPLAAGSGGGSENNAYQHFGAGGGAIQISAGQSIHVRALGVIQASGGGGGNGGGGSGGAILLEAPSIDIEGILAANGGSGGNSGTAGARTGSNGNPNAIPAPGPVSSDGIAGGIGSAGTSINGGAGGNAVDGGATTGSGGGGAGFVRLNVACGSTVTLGANAIVSPDLSTVCSTQGFLSR